VNSRFKPVPHADRFPIFSRVPSVRQVRPYGNKRTDFAEAVALSKAPALQHGKDGEARLAPE